MRIHKIFGSALVAGSAGLFLIGTAAAQPRLPSAEGVQERVPADTGVDAQAETRARTKTQIEGQTPPRTNIDTRGNVEADAQIDSTVRPRTEGELAPNARVDSSARARGESRTDFGFQFHDDQEQSLTLSSVQANGLAAQAGLRTGDRIVSIDGQQFASRAQMDAYLAERGRGQVDVMFDRDGRRWRTSLMHPGQQIAARGQINGRESQRVGAPFAPGSRGIVVNDLHEGSPLLHAGLQPGDEIVCFNGWAYRDVNQFVTTIERMPRNQPIAVNVIRDGRWLATNITLSDGEATTYADARGQAQSGDYPPVPPAPRSEEPGAAPQRDQFAQSDAQGRRTALRPNFDEASQEQMQRQIDRLRNENERLRQELNQYRNEEAPADPADRDRLDRSEEAPEAPARPEADVEAETVPEPDPRNAP